MPSSFKGPHGQIIYKIQAKLSRSWKFDRTVEKDICFVSMNVPNFQSMLTHQVDSVHKEMGLFSKGHVHMEAKIDRRAYAPGETVVVIAKVKNNSSSDMIPKLKLIQDVMYHAKGSKKLENSVIQKVSDSCVGGNTERTLRMAIQIPRNQMYTISNCDLMSVTYHLKLYLDISFSFDPRIIFPLVIVPPNLMPGFSGGPSSGVGGPGIHASSSFGASAGFYPRSPRSGSPRYSGAHGYTPPPPPLHVYSGYGQAGMYPAQPAHTSWGYNNPAPRQPSPYGSPFSSSSSSPVLHPPPPTAPPLHPSPPPRSATPTRGLSPTASGYHQLPAFHPPPSAPPSHVSPSAPPTLNVSPSAPSYDAQTFASMTDVDFLSQNDEAPPAYSLLFPSNCTDAN